MIASLFGPIFRPDIHVHPILPDMAKGLRNAFIAGWEQGFLLAAVALILVYLFWKEKRK